MVDKKRQAILITNLGSPDAPTPEALRPYLDEFLMDPYVIDLPWPLRALIVRGFILRKRSVASAEAYERIWTAEGSPLVVSTRSLTRKIQILLGDSYVVKFAMRYANPSLRSALDAFRSEGFSECKVLPLYPQWALASTGSTLAYLKKLQHPCRVNSVLKPFYEHPDFLRLFSKRLQESRAQFSKENLKTHYLFSFHGVPERHIRKSPACRMCPINEACCLKSDAPSFCYRSHCFKTTLGIARLSELSPEDYSLSFQSRLGIDQWLKPFTDHRLKELPGRDAVERLVMLSPAFTADCLETLEELAMRGKEDFLAAGGKEFHLVPSLNDGDDWAEVLARWIGDPSLFESCEASC